MIAHIFGLLLYTASRFPP